MALIAFQQGSAQLPDYHVQLFDESFGIRTNDVKRVIRDKQGFVWVMHNDRMQRFDGKHVKDYIFDTKLYSFICDSNNQIWVSATSKVYRLSNDARGFDPIEIDTIKKIEVYQLYALPGNKIWLLSNKGFFVFDVATQSFIKHPDPRLANLRKIHSRGPDDARCTESLYFTMGDSVMCYQPGSGLLIAMPGKDMRKASALTNEMAFVSTWTGVLYLYDFSRKTITNIDLSHHLKNVQDFFIVVEQAVPMGNNKFLLASSKGLMEYDMYTGDFRQLKLFQKGKPLEGNMVFFDLSVDAEGTAWAAYNNYGVISFKKMDVVIGLLRNHETDITRAWDNHVRNFAEDNKQNLWLATANGFACLDMKQGSIQPYFAKEGATDRLNHYSVRGIVYDGHNLILGQANKGIWLYDPVTKSYKRPSYLPGQAGEATRKKIDRDFIDQIYTLRSGDHIAVARDGGYVLDGKTYRLYELDFPGKKENLNFCYQDTDENIWIGTTRAVYCLYNNFDLRIKIPAKQTNGRVYGVCEWEKGTIIIGGKGLFIATIRDTTAQLKSIDPFFDDISIYILYKDKLNKLWLGTSEGLFRYDMKSRKIESFSNFENIEGNSFYANSFYRSSLGLLLLGSNRGIIYFNPEQIREEKDSLNIFISKVMVNKDDTSYNRLGHPFHLKYFQNTIDIDFVAPYFDNTNKLKYRYRLEGLDTGWTTNNNNNTARFHALRPGNYRFRAAASVNGVDWFESKEEIVFNIHPSFWKRGWFYAIVLLLIGAGIYTLYRYQLNKKLEVERLRMGIARDLHDDIGSALSNIHIISSMEMNKQVSNGGAGQVFRKIKESSKAILENMQDIVWAINPKNDTLEQVLAKMKEFAGELCESAGVDYTFETGPGLDMIKLTVNKRKDLFLVFKEAINNAVKYSQGTKIHISLLRQQTDWLRLKITDNGKGFAKNEIHPGNGLRNMKERAKEVNGQIEIETVSGQGTTVELLLPIT